MALLTTNKDNNNVVNINLNLVFKTMIYLIMYLILKNIACSIIIPGKLQNYNFL
ncbi:MAG: hypothetical protein BWY47_00811 [Bacteroidetes bacterium ADurb.Bin302]|nr:MAG: hypothetical protein BWY47_00811 [Bacteroidetes bacterium ADurb.Bin302]